MHKYQNVSEVSQTLIGDGDISPRTVKPGEFVESSVPLENPNFKYVSSSKDATPEAPKEEAGNV